jgi:5-methylcytosine-specific restriction endonuclease McrA
VSPEVWALIARELITLRQLARNWLDPTRAAKIERHVEAVRQLVREATGGREDKRRAVMWWRDPCCFWCGRVTRLTKPQGDHSAATVDHVYPRGHPRRRDPRKHLPSFVLACAKCNHERGAPQATTGGACPFVKSVGRAA